ncbi:MAG TPA: hypothetical protein PLE82_07550 [Saccharofermentans sp.]|nr:hypothetical protein [Saccharofermentans sp.]
MTTEIKTIAEALDLEALLPEEQEEILLELNSLVFKGSLLRLIERMDEKTKEDFNALMDTEPEEEMVLAFLESRVPDADKAVTETLEELTGDILAVTS